MEFNLKQDSLDKGTFVCQRVPKQVMLIQRLVTTKSSEDTKTQQSSKTVSGDWKSQLKDLSCVRCDKCQGNELTYKSVDFMCNN